MAHYKCKADPRDSIEVDFNTSGDEVCISIQEGEDVGFVYMTPDDAIDMAEQLRRIAWSIKLQGNSSG